MNLSKVAIICLTLFLMTGCRKQNSARVYFKIKFDPLQERLNSSGIVAGIGSGNAAQTPLMNTAGIEALEILRNAQAQPKDITTLFSVSTTTSGGNPATDYSKLIMVKDGDTFLSVPISNISPGKYEWLRIAIPFQNFDIRFNMLNVPFIGDLPDERATLASFISSENYITKYKIWEKEDVVNGNKKRGYWSLETRLNPAYNSLNTIFRGYITDNTITFVNPIVKAATSTNASSFITGKLDTPLSITGSETEDITIVLTLSINNMFEWEENINRNGKWDINTQGTGGQPQAEKIKDLGFRSLKVLTQNK